MRNLRSLYFRHYFFSFFHFVSWDEKGETSLVQALHDFRHNCTPTWLFIASGMIDYWWCHHWQWLMCNSKVSDPVLPLGQLLDLVGSNPSTVPRSKASNRKLQNCRGSNISVCIPSTDTLSNMGNDWAHPSGIIIHQRQEKDAKEDGDEKLWWNFIRWSFGRSSDGSPSRPKPCFVERNGCQVGRLQRIEGSRLKIPIPGSSTRKWQCWVGWPSERTVVSPRWSQVQLSTLEPSF